MDTYLEILNDCFSSIVTLLGKNSIVVQLVAFSKPEAELPAYLDIMQLAGLEEIRIGEVSGPDNRIWRTVPNRKWYADLKGNLAASKEVLLIHRKARS
jgi:hypothetical protein